MSDQSLYEMVIVGAGPAGISMACEAVEAGISPEKVLILEKANQHSWSIRKYYPDDKLVTANYKGNDANCTGVLCLKDSSKNETLTYLDEAILKYNLKVRYQESVKGIEQKTNGQFLIQGVLDNYMTKTCVVAIGVFGQPNRPSYEIPKELESQVFFDVTSSDFAKDRVLVVGGGDSASEYCQFLSQRGKETFLSYRKGEFSRMNDINQKSIQTLEDNSKVNILFNTNIDRLEKNSDQIRVQFLEEQSSIDVDYIVYALGGSSPKEFLKAVGIALTKEGAIVSEHNETNTPGLFLIGDLSAGKKGGSINTAFNSANTAMKEFCRYYLDCRI